MTKVVEKDDPHARRKLLDRMPDDHVPGVSNADVPCFAGGTSLATPRGEVAVDALTAAAGRRRGADADGRL